MEKPVQNYQEFFNISFIQEITICEATARELCSALISHIKFPFDAIYSITEYFDADDSMAIFREYFYYCTSIVLSPSWSDLTSSNRRIRKLGRTTEVIFLLHLSRLLLKSNDKIKIEGIFKELRLDQNVLQTGITNYNHFYTTSQKLPIVSEPDLNICLQNIFSSRLDHYFEERLACEENLRERKEINNELQVLKSELIESTRELQKEILKIRGRFAFATIYELA